VCTTVYVCVHASEFEGVCMGVCVHVFAIACELACSHEGMYAINRVCMHVSSREDVSFKTCLLP